MQEIQPSLTLEMNHKSFVIKVLESSSSSKLVLYQNPDSSYFVSKMVPFSKYFLLEKEFRILKEFPHPNIIEAFSLANDKGWGYLTLEYAKFSDLIGFLNFFYDKICLLFRTISTYEKFWRSLFWQIVSAFTFLQKNGVAHGDIKPDNILLTENFEIKVTDFEFGTEFKTDSSEKRISEKIWGTDNYLSPELRERKTPYDPIKSDVFSLGVTFLNLMSRDDLFPSKEKKRQIRIKRTDLVDVLKTGAENIWGQFALGAKVSNDFKKMAEKMLAFDPEERWSFEEVLGSEWMQGERFNSEEMKKIMWS